MSLLKILGGMVSSDDKYLNILVLEKLGITDQETHNKKLVIFLK